MEPQAECWVRVANIRLTPRLRMNLPTPWPVSLVRENPYARLAYHHWRQLLHPGAAAVCHLGPEHSLAAFLPGLDVSRHCVAGPAQEPLGILHRHLRRRTLGLWKPLRHHVLY